ncbi:MAG: tetratricopeptide repeat protein [Deltaproteobacteria bacterium]|nr:tetratricopeptide repeat protein [Deltaproteobacteria bacterium]
MTRTILGVRRGWVTVLGMFVCILALSDVATGSPESRELILQGHADMTKGDYEEALKKFVGASKADPKDAEALYFEGAALNRLGRFDEALSRLEKAASLGFKGAGLTFDTGWALLRLGKWIDAVVQFEHFEKTIPGRGKTSEFLGQAYFGLKQYDRAEAKLKEAIQRDPELKSTALLHLALVEMERKNNEAAARYIETLLREVPDSPIAKTLKSQTEPMPGPEKK